MTALRNTESVAATLLQVEPKPADPHVVDLESIKRSRKGRKIDNWFAIALIVAASVFAGAVAAYVLSPAISTLVSGQAWTPEGP